MKEEHAGLKGIINGVLLGILSWAAIIAVIVWLSGCTVMGSKPELYSCVAEPRELEDVDVTIRYASPFIGTDRLCREQIAETGGSALPWFLSMYSACATLPCDSHIPEGGRPYCKVVFPYGTEPGHELWEHEMKHCQGYQH